jgi:Flp pilus assembly protein TadG
MAATASSAHRPPPRTPQWRRWPVLLRRVCAGQDGERGSVAAQVVIAIPLLVLLVLLIVQFALAAYAEHIAQGAADQALDTSRTMGGTDADGQTQAQAVLAQLATGPLTHPIVSVTRDATTVTVTITGTAETLVPGFTLRVHAEASGPIETFAPDTP